jgi:hypothetical protein
MATATATDYLLVTTAASTYQPLSSHLTTLAGIDKTNNNFIVTNGTTFTYVNGSAARASLGLGTMATETASNYNTAAVDATTYAPLASPTFTGIVTTAGQIKFPATANPSSDVNTLDDYEEGTWTPVIGSTGGSITTYTSSGRYTKIGNRVITDLTFQITNLGTASGYLTATLPFTAVGASAATGREYTVNGASVHGTTINGSASITLVTYNNSTTIFSNNQTITISLSYVV